jgi:streptogramin lyase
MRPAHWLRCIPLLAFAQLSLADEPRYLWVPNGDEGTVSKLDAATGEEVARYASITHASLINHTGRTIPPWGAAHRPERVALDFHGDAWVSNTASGIQPSATKFWNHEPNCVDRNGNLQIDTSREVNLTPGIQLADPAEFFGEADECIAFTVVVGALSGEARALAIDRGVDPGGGGHAWIGISFEQAFYQIDGETAALLQRVPPAGAGGNSPFTAAIDVNGILWATNWCCGLPRLWRIDTLTGAATTTSPPGGFSCNGSFGITIDLTGRVWLGGYPCASAIRYDPSTSSWSESSIANQAPFGGMGIGLDRLGNVWLSLATSGDGRVARVETSSGASTGVWDNSGSAPFAAAVGFDGDVWSINRYSDNVSRLHLDPVTHEPAPHPMTGNVVDLFPVGNTAESSGDFTGLALHTIVRPAPPGHIFADGFYSGSTVAWSATVP